MPTLKIDKGEARDDGPWIRSEGHWGQLICHRVYLKHGLVSIAPNGPPDNYNYWSAMKVDWEGDPAEGSGPGRFSGTRDPIAVEIGRQWAAILDGQGGMVPKLGPIALDPVKVATEPYENTAYAKLIAADPPPKQPSPSVPVKYFSIYDGACLMVGTNPTSDNDLSRRWTIITAKGDLLPGNEYAARYFINGEIGCEEISAEEAGYKAAALGGSLEAAVNR